MGPLFQSVTDLASQAETVRRRRYGVIETAGGRFVCLRLRPFPKPGTLWEPLLLGRWQHGRRAGDRCLLFYNQPRGFPQFLALAYVVSAAGTSFTTFHRALQVLDEVARIKGVEALLCDVSNRRISERLLARWGWQPHAPAVFHRNYIKRLSRQPAKETRFSDLVPVR